MSGFWAILHRDMMLARAESGGALLAVQFFALGILLFPLGLGPEPGMLGRIGGGLPAALALGTPTLSLVGAVGASLTIGARRGGVLLALLVLPLYIPVLIFMSGTVTAAETGLAFSSHISILGAIMLVSLVLTPWAAAAALRQIGE